MLHEFWSTYVYDGCLSEENHDTLNKYTMYLGKILKYFVVTKITYI